MTNTPDLPALVPAAGGAVLAICVRRDRRAGRDEARALFRSGDVLVAHAVFVAGRLKAPPQRLCSTCWNCLPLCVRRSPAFPAPLGLARALDACRCRQTPENPPAPCIPRRAHCSTNCARFRRQNGSGCVRSPRRCESAGWRWAPVVLYAIGQPERALPPLAGYDAWRGLPKWEDEAPPGKPGSHAGNAQPKRSARLASAGRQPRSAARAIGLCRRRDLCFRRARTRRARRRSR